MVILVNNANVTYPAMMGCGRFEPLARPAERKAAVVGRDGPGWELAAITIAGLHGGARRVDGACIVEEDKGGEGPGDKLIRSPKAERRGAGDGKDDDRPKGDNKQDK